ncbi:aminophospholipid translocase (flippase), putative [Candida dubliniensis CD36]|uniref:Phospholipid-transporting ATPase n=1 Tax=Candida dubliniensis (strain CD36 / ATCC MYA-646 / CBS 7987 / NCPF 3949 / NRRL Y-17841) TaxID=573826 RepID=B9WDT2_CANDC|nr:aminophospholipid translocase (flippase), putative [Candida dubliniensis CD36]CAX42839.1 aminophospholipid translocase (flippase), putative [Candida dubliniensis CD36]
MSESKDQSTDSTSSPGLQSRGEPEPPGIKERIHRFFFLKGLADRPPYLQEIYDNTPRTVFYNYDLPEYMIDSQGRPITQYPRNKIRTTKYTPITFLPKNLLLQFTNVANSYFLLIVILGAFQIFGVPSPGLAAVPLIVIVCITAIKDAVEDYSRAVSDAELNNSPIHLLTGVHNPNVLVDQVGPWRKFKKACSRGTAHVFKFIKKCCIFICGNKRIKQEYAREQVQEDNLALHRVSTVVSDYTYRSQEPRYSVSSPRRSMNINRKSIQSSHHRPTVALPNSLLNPVLKKENAQNSSSVRANFKNRCWKDVNIGDIIRIRANEEVPADVIIISTSDSEGNCYIETKNLDGESNLKTRTALKCGGNNNLKHSDDLSDTKFWVECDAPNANLYSFKGTIHYENFDSNGNLVNEDEKEAITPENVLLRGCTLRNTKWVIGFCIYTGPETKIMLNSGITPTKTSRISRELNLSVIINFVLLFVLCFVSGLINGLFYRHDNNSRVFFDFHPYGKTPAINGVIAFWVALIIYQSLVPISLYISIEIIKTIQAYFIYADVKMYYDRLDFPCIAKAWNISDDLGQIEYVFSDKTGTLTQNVMEFRKCTINGKSYGLAYTEAQQGLDKRAGVDVIEEANKWKIKIASDKEAMMDDLLKYSNNDQLREENITFVSSQYVRDTFSGDSGDEQKQANERFMFALALCHTVMTEENETDPTLRDFKAESPDEAALVSVARDMGIVFKKRLRSSLLLEIYGQEQEFHLLDIIPFTSARKRMSCVIKTPENKIILYTKGADSVIFQRLNPSENPNELVRKTALYLEDFANEGLRTLCIASKVLDPQVYENWNRRYREASSSISDDRETLMGQLEEEIEQDLVMLGGTAIEDRLQLGVPQSISILSDAGIKLWVLTGDRVETAINIGFSCNLLENDMKLLVVRPESNDTEDCEQIDALITKYLQEEFHIDASSPSSVADAIKQARKDHSIPQAKVALVIDGAALSLIFQDLKDRPNDTIRVLQDKFLLLGKQCRSVLCCRVSPAQKAQVVKLVKTGLQVMTLAIGDGANDVAMIQAANVGVGIAGEEGRQAVMSSDYAIGQFRFLTRLLLVHGRWSYKRLAEMIPCFFYKNVVFTLTCFWYGIYNNFDGSYLYEYTYLMFYNLAFTSLPVIVLAVFDQDVSDTISLLVPQLYTSGILGKDWSQYKFVWYMFDGLYQSVISFFFPYLLFYVAFQNPQGMTIDHRFYIGVVAACIAVTACDIYVLMQQYRWDWLSVLIDCISILLVYFWTGVWSVNPNYSGEFYRAGAQTLGTLGVWCCIFVGIIGCLLPRFTFDFFTSNFRPADVDIIRERVRQGAYDDYPLGYDPTDAEDVERHRLLTEIINKDPQLFEKMENEYKEEEHDKETPLERTFKSIKRRTTISRSKKGTAQRLRRDTINDQFQKQIPLDELRQQMIKEGEYTSARYSLDRINTTHEIPGVTQADTLLKYHTRNSVALNS